MIRTTRRSASRLHFSSVSTIVLMALMVACGGDDEPQSNPTGGADATAKVAEAEQLVEELMAPVPWRLDAPPLDVGTQLQGKRVVLVTNGLTQFVENVTQGMQDAGELAGVTVTAFNGEGNTSKAARFIEQAIATDADAVVVLSFLTEQLLEPIKAATDAGIPVIQQFEHDPGPNTPIEDEAGVFANVSSCYECAGREMAQLVVADSGGEANVVFVNVPDVGVANLETDGFESEMERLCPGCTVRVTDAPIAQWNQQLPSIATSAAADQKVDYIVPVFDGMVGFMKAPVIAANAQDRIKFVSFNADLGPMQELQNGDEPAWAGIVGSDAVWIGWGTMDNVFRALLEEEPVFDQAFGDRAFTPENIDEIDLSMPDSSWYGDTDFQGQYADLWGLG